MKGTGKTISNMARALKLGMRDLSMRECTLTERKKVLENISGLMALFMKVNGSTIALTERESIYGKMGENTMESGKIMIWKALVYTSGQMGVYMKVNIRMIRNVDTESITGLMDASMKAGGTRVNSMDLVLISILLRGK
jgi:hypothetical protein